MHFQKQLDKIYSKFPKIIKSWNFDTSNPIGMMKYRINFSKLMIKLAKDLDDFAKKLIKDGEYQDKVLLNEMDN